MIAGTEDFHDPAPRAGTETTSTARNPAAATTQSTPQPYHLSPGELASSGEHLGGDGFKAIQMLPYRGSTDQLPGDTIYKRTHTHTRKRGRLWPKGGAHSNRSEHPDDNKIKTGRVSRGNRSLVAKEMRSEGAAESLARVIDW
ncbi:hypothetical protein BHE74_00040633 [Ensete ventricosum]|nr:hypothetical protein BHE74_00040633 [Ensete ventricosum]